MSIKKNSDIVCVIIPCYNEEKRLDVESFYNYACELRKLIFVNDCSTDQTENILARLSNGNTNIFYLSLKQHSGKSEAVRQGFLYAVDKHTNSNWYCFIDADLSAPLREIDNMLGYKDLYLNTPSAIFGSRFIRLGANIERDKFRLLASRVMAISINFIFKTQLNDAFCGLKLFRSESMELAFSKPFLSRWLFDLEVLFRLGVENVIEYSLQEWNHKPESKLKLYELVLFVIELFKIKRNYR